MRKCSVFGINNEAIPRQVNFLTNQASNYGKGANTVISRVHYFFDQLSLGKRIVDLHTDNCTGQNKNNIVIQYRGTAMAHTNWLTFRNPPLISSG